MTNITSAPLANTRNRRPPRARPVFVAAALLGTAVQAVALPAAAEDTRSVTTYQTTYLNAQPLERVELNGQYYDFNVPGLGDLCAAQPGACAHAGVRLSLDHLQERATLSRNLTVAGWATLIVALVPLAFLGSAAVSEQHGNGSNAVGLMVASTGVLSLGGLGLTVAGDALAPTRKEVTGVINQINAAQPEAPARIQAGGAAGAGVGLGLAGLF